MGDVVIITMAEFTSQNNFNLGLVDLGAVAR